MQQRDPGAGQPTVAGCREVHPGDDRELLGVDVGHQEAVEQDERVGAGVVQPQRDLSDRAEMWTELDRHRNGDGCLDLLEDLDVALFDVAAGGPRIVGHVVDVELDRRGAGLLERVRVLRSSPSAWRR